MGGGDVTAAFAATLKQIGTNLTPEDLLMLYPMASESDKKDATPIVLEKCKYFDLFDGDPGYIDSVLQEEEGRVISTGHHPLKLPRFDYRLTSREKAKLAASGVLAVERMPAKSFADAYDQLYRDDMPVFVTSDSVLHAWHRSFDAFLVELEVEILFFSEENS
ncbi:uncharacterized protein IUM83_15517 [Phytophthora cinnamomi]|uniref:uncharacterized protein n=1 Tax=Phytophthora cinnamomi TaxID=4785 RepID=UPI00355A00D1|nr:hypothetical protein IUM83_15517 [Phytophthora cinnamomi]